jgi:acyl-CoA reductase-like NAD-dependent aldehyde dehydrogenase
MSVFDVLGATATIIQFIEYGIKFGGKAIAVYNGGSQFADLNQTTKDFQQTNEAFKANLQLRSTGPDSGEEVLLKIAEECRQTAEELTQLIGRLSMKQGERSRWKALKSTIIIEYKKKGVSTLQGKLELRRQRCHEQLTIMIRYVFSSF